MKTNQGGCAEPSVKPLEVTASNGWMDKGCPSIYLLLLFSSSLNLGLKKKRGMEQTGSVHGGEYWAIASLDINIMSDIMIIIGW